MKHLVETMLKELSQKWLELVGQMEGIKKLKILFCFTATGTAALPNFRKLSCGWPGYA